MTALERENILPPRNHNNPPDPIEILRAELAETHVPLRERGDALTAMGDRLPASCDDDDTAAKLADAIKSCTAFTKNADAARVAAKEPHLAAGRAVDGFFKAMSDPVEKVKTAMGALLTAYQRRKEAEERRRREEIAAAERKAAQEAERAAREAARLAREAQQEADEAKAAEAKAAADKARDDARAARAEADKAREEAQAKAADLSRSRTDLGSVASLRTVWTFEVENADEVPRLYLSVSETAIKSAIKAATTRDGKCPLKIPGVKIFAKSETVVR